MLAFLNFLINRRRKGYEILEAEEQRDIKVMQCDAALRPSQTFLLFRKGNIKI
jgi:hypothetical protein